MQIPPPTLLLAAAALLLNTGCADSPFKIKTRINPDSVIVEVDAYDNVRVDYKDIAPGLLSSALNNIGAHQPGRPVSLVVDEGTNPSAEDYVVKQAREAGLGEVSIINRSKLHGTYKSRPADVVDAKKSRAPEKTEKTTTAATVASTPPVPAQTTPASPPATPPETPPATVAPAPVAPATPTAPAVPAAPVAVTGDTARISVRALANGAFEVDGSPVAKDALESTFRALSTAKPAATIEISRDDATERSVISDIRRAARAAGYTRFGIK